MRKFTNWRVPARAMLGLVLAFACSPLLSAYGSAEEVAGSSFGIAADALSGAIPATPPKPEAAAPANPALPAVQPAPAGAPIVLGRKPDYYTQRAIETVKQDERAADRFPHPLAAKYPGFSVVVCEGGCVKDRGPEIVYVGKKPKVEVVSDNVMVPTSSSAAGPAKALPNDFSRWIDCLAGCYDTPKRYAAPVPLKETRLVPGRPLNYTSPAIPSRGPFSPIR